MPAAGGPLISLFLHHLYKNDHISPILWGGTPNVGCTLFPIKNHHTFPRNAWNFPINVVDKTPSPPPPPLPPLLLQCRKKSKIIYYKFSKTFLLSVSHNLYLYPFTISRFRGSQPPGELVVVGLYQFKLRYWVLLKSDLISKNSDIYCFLVECFVWSFPWNKSPIC